MAFVVRAQYDADALSLISYLLPRDGHGEARRKDDVQIRGKVRRGAPRLRREQRHLPPGRAQVPRELAERQAHAVGHEERRRHDHHAQLRRRLRVPTAPEKFLLACGRAGGRRALRMVCLRLRRRRHRRHRAAQQQRAAAWRLLLLFLLLLRLPRLRGDGLLPLPIAAAADLNAASAAAAPSFAAAAAAAAGEASAHHHPRHGRGVHVGVTRPSPPHTQPLAPREAVPQHSHASARE